jgi:hypothetical protein
MARSITTIDPWLNVLQGGVDFPRPFSFFNRGLSMSMTRFCLLGLVCLFLCTIHGCGSDSSTKDQLPVVAAKGKILIKGQPIPGLNLLFIPMNPDQKIRPQAQVSANGSFEVTTYKTGDGGPEGEYKVVLSLPSDPSISDSKKEELAAKCRPMQKKSLSLPNNPALLPCQ